MKTPMAQRSVDRRTAAILILATVIFTVSFAVHSGALRNEFLNYDDNFYVYENFRIEHLSGDTILWFFTHGYYNSYIPLTMVSHALDYALWGMNPLGHHLTSLILHSVNAVWMFLIGIMVLVEVQKRAGLSEEDLQRIALWTILGAAFAALLFSLHPLRTESVGWVSDRKDVLCAFFLLPSMAAYLSYASGKRGKGWYWISFVLLLAAILSKSIAVMAPLVMVLFDFLLFSRRPVVRTLIEKIPMFLASVGAGLAAEHFLPPAAVHAFVSDASSLQRTLFPAYAVIFYPQHMLWPVGLIPLYVLPDVGTMVVAVCLSMLMVVSCILAFRRMKFWWVLLWGIYLVLLAPTLFGLHAAIQPLADRYSYLFTMPFCFLGGGALAFVFGKDTWKKPEVVRGLAGALSISVLVVLGVASSHQMTYWRTSESLWQRQVAVQPIGFAYNNLGNALLDEDNVDGAIEAFDSAAQLGPDYVSAYNNLGSAYFRKGENDEEARQAFEKVIGLKPDNIDAYMSLASVLRRDGQIRDATEACDKSIANSRSAISKNPLDIEAYYQLGCGYYFNGDTAHAVQSFVSLLKINPNYGPAYFNLGVIYGNQRNDEFSLEAFRRAARLGNRDARLILADRGFEW